jgi:hypothetical protein
MQSSCMPVIIHAAKNMNEQTKRSLAVESICQHKTLSQIASENKVSRKFVSSQKNKLMGAINDAFSIENVNEEEILFTLPVTKSWLKQFTASLLLDCRSSFRGVIKSANNLLDYDISIGSICNTVKSLVQKTKSINVKQDLTNIKLCAQDEMFQHNKPVLTGVDISSLYCFLLSQEEQRDADTWAINLLDLQKQNFNPERVIADDGSGFRAGHNIVFPKTPCDGDNFHMTKALTDLRRFFRNKLKTAISDHISMNSKLEKAIARGHSEKYLQKYEISKQEEDKMRYLSETIDTLVSWMEHDIFNMAGTAPTIRYELFDFIVDEFKKLEERYSHRIRAIRIALKNQKDLLLSFTKVLNEKFILIAKKCFISLETVWKMCELQRCKQGGDNYAIRSLRLQFQLDEKYDDVEDAVIAAMESTERTSSMIENLNSRLRPYFFLRKEIGHGYLDLLQFYLNHTPFMRSENEKRVGKSPAELLTHKPHDHWLVLLGFKQFKRAV